MTKTLTRPRKRYEIARAVDNGPTPERLAKSVFTLGNPPRVLTTVQALLNAGDITQDAANAAERWYRDYIFGKNGYVEFKPDHVPDTITKHDDVSWQVVRANSWGNVLDVKYALGLYTHRRLEMMLIDEMSFAQMGAALRPEMSQESARKKLAAQCSIILEQLAEFYLNIKRKQRQKDKDCTAVPVMVCV